MIHNLFLSLASSSIGMFPLITSTASSDTVLHADDMRSAAVRCIFLSVVFFYSLSSESAQISAPYRRTACVVDMNSLLLLCVGPSMLAINLLRDAVACDASCAECCSCAVKLSLQSTFRLLLNVRLCVDFLCQYLHFCSEWHMSSRLLISSSRVAE